MIKGWVFGLALVCAGAAPALASAPSDFIPQGATKVTESGNVTEYDVAADPYRVADFYQKLLPGDGYSVSDSVRSPAAIQLFFSRGESSEGSVVIRPRGNVSHVVLTVTE